MDPRGGRGGTYRQRRLPATFEAHAVDALIFFFREEQATIGRHQDRDGATPDFRFLRIADEAGDEILVVTFGAVIVAERDEDDFVPGELGAIPTAPAGGEGAFAILRR